MKHRRAEISKKRKQKLIEFQNKLQVRFRNLDLLNTSLSHKSFVNEVPQQLENNEKLEFLGDSVLGLVVSDILFNQKIYLKEGSLARIKSYVVSEATLYKVGKKLDIQNFILIGRGEEKSGGRNRKALISDCLEAVIGAYYQDAGFKRAAKLVRRLFYEEIIQVEKNRHEKDYKSILQEYTQKQFRTVPQYSVVDTKGPDHRRKYYITVKVHKKTYGPGIGESKKEAEQQVALLALKQMRRVKELRDPSIENTSRIRKKSKRRGNLVRPGKKSARSRQDAQK
jgi:ribonuclease-3